MFILDMENFSSCRDILEILGERCEPDESVIILNIQLLV